MRRAAFHDRAMVPEAPPEETEAGLVPASKGWFVMTRHVFVGTGNGPCVILAASSRQFQTDGPWSFYCADETARRYNASSPEDTQDGEVAYGRFPASQPMRYRDGLLRDWVRS